MPPKVPQTEIEALADKLKLCVVGSQEYNTYKEQQKRWHRAKHQDTTHKPQVRLSGTTVYVKQEQVDPVGPLAFLRIGLLTSGFLDECKRRKTYISLPGNRDARTAEAYAWLTNVCGSTPLDKKTAEFLLSFSDLHKRFLETHGNPDPQHLEVIRQRIAFFLKGKYALACVAAFEEFCPMHFDLFVNLINTHPNAQRTAVKVKAAAVGGTAAVVCVDMEDNPDDGGAARGGGGGCAAVARYGSFMEGDDIVHHGGGAAVARGGGARGARGGGARGGGARGARGGGATYVMAEAPVTSGKDKQRAYSVLEIPISSKPKKMPGSTKFGMSIVIVLLGFDGLAYCYFHTLDDAKAAIPSLAGAVLLEDAGKLEQARQLQKESYLQMQAMRNCHAVGGGAPVSSRRGPVAEETDFVARLKGADGEVMLACASELDVSSVPKEASDSDSEGITVLPTFLVAKRPSKKNQTD
jgi:hypothetical protein